MDGLKSVSMGLGWTLLTVMPRLPTSLANADRQICGGTQGAFSEGRGIHAHLNHAVFFCHETKIKKQKYL
jgi:hypothetical protein